MMEYEMISKIFKTVGSLVQYCKYILQFGRFGRPNSDPNNLINIFDYVEKHSNICRKIGILERENKGVAIEFE